ncbi:MAG: YbjN domain-containing protein [Comamonadaceae bacterium]|nr:MAG: YbjN domain-containing protein [Comamonadaceae bacterium]
MSEAPDVADEAEKAVDGAVDDARTVLEAAAAEGEDQADTLMEEGRAALSGLDTHTVGRILNALGRSYKIGTDALDDPLITIDIGETGASEMYVEYYDCGPAACESIQLVTRFKAGKAGTLKAVNAFNRENRWARVYLDEDNEPTIELDIDGVGGITEGALTRQIMAYLEMVDALGSALGKR